jgi:hypothetical protein
MYSTLGLMRTPHSSNNTDIWGQFDLESADIPGEPAAPLNDEGERK